MEFSLLEGKTCTGTVLYELSSPDGEILNRCQGRFGDPSAIHARCAREWPPAGGGPTAPSSGHDGRLGGSGDVRLSCGGWGCTMGQAEGEASR